jgi:lyso-ornithine lipid O-acyltransferase
VFAPISLLSRWFRLCFRFLWLSEELLLAALRYVPVVLLRAGDRRVRARALWLQQSCCRLLRVLHLEVDTRGPVPSTGLLACNHLSYLDIVVLGALTPAVFVAKREVERWPIFGWFAALGGTVFVDRERRTRTGRTVAEIRRVLESGQLLVLFPEGTSSDGKTVLPFKPSLLQAATSTASPVSAGALTYELEDGDVSEEVCYWKDMTFFPHLLNLLTKDSIFAHINLLPVDTRTTCRKALALHLHSLVLRLNALEFRLEEPVMSENPPPGSYAACRS